MANQEWLTPQEAAEILKVSKNTIYKLLREGFIPSVQIGRRHRITRASLDALASPPTMGPPTRVVY